FKDQAAVRDRLGKLLQTASPVNIFFHRAVFKKSDFSVMTPRPRRWGSGASADYPYSKGDLPGQTLYDLSLLTKSLKRLASDK
ncbi:hypothetical protein, partial [Geomesophilobacter sediminis]|uniref:hypothetical protein n=1 Tax=Geomesophilobacter sediminis TaxID=2798584 RepID=UPI001C0778AD